MDLTLKESTEYPHEGYGAGEGTIIREAYICPCGNGTVFYEKDDIPGFRDKSSWSDCKTCDEKYLFRRGTAELK